MTVMELTMQPCHVCKLYIHLKPLSQRDFIASNFLHHDLILKSFIFKMYVSLTLIEVKPEKTFTTSCSLHVYLDLTNNFRSGMLTNGVERVIEQLVNPKILHIIKPKIDEVICKQLGIDPEKRKEHVEQSKQQHMEKMQNMQSLMNVNVTPGSFFSKLKKI